VVQKLATIKLQSYAVILYTT